ncbi:MAG: hypothetical protein K6E87_07100 [bacterium]|nr:hypothetical protein [bacterium]
MKKLLFLILVPLCFLGLMKKAKASSADYIIQLEDDECYVPVGGNIEAALPRAFIYDPYEGDVVTSEGLIYSYDYQGIKLSNINRYVAGRYFIYMTVTHRNYSCRLFQRVDIIIYDEVEPTVTMNNNIRISYKDDFNIYNYFSYTDNASTPCTVSIMGYYDPKTIGTYDLTLVVSDLSNNETYVDFTLDVYDNVAPNIICDDVIEIDYDKECDLNDYIKAVDECEGEVEFEASDYDKKTLGEKPVQIIAKDSSYNFAIKNVILKVCDKTCPKIELKSLELDEYEDFDLKENIVNVTDNYDDVKVDNIEISKSKVKGNRYLVTYTISDSSGNKAVKECFINYLYHNVPVIEEINLDDLKDEFDPLYYVNCYDAEDGDLNDKVMVVDMNYNEKYCIYEVYDSDGNFTRKRIDFVNIEDLEKYEDKPKLNYPEVPASDMEEEKVENDAVKNSNVTKTTNYNFIYYIAIGLFVLGIIIFILIKHFRKKMV